MDYGFAPGRSGGRDRQNGRLRMMFTQRANTTLVSRHRITPVRHFITRLDAAGDIARPIGNLLIGARAHSEGWVLTPTLPPQRGPTDVETFAQTLADPARPIEAPDALIGRNNGVPITHSAHVKGYTIGNARPFPVKFREAFGHHVRVTAPEHLHSLTPARHHGVFEHMGCEFIVCRRAAFAGCNSRRGSKIGRCYRIYPYALLPERFIWYREFGL